MKNNPLIFTLLLILSTCGLGDAHTDTRLSLKGGKIVGLPKDYSPASFDFKKLSLSIRGKQLTFPKVLFHLLMHDTDDDPFGGIPSWKLRPYTYKFSASWYHGDMIDALPPYMLITITPTDSEDRYELLIDMKKVQFISATICTKALGRAPIDLDGIPDNPK